MSKIRDDFFKKVSEVKRSVPYNSSEVDNEGKRIFDFGYKVVTGNEIYTVTDFGSIWNWFEKRLNQSNNGILSKWKRAMKKATAIGGFRGYEIIEEEYLKAKKEINK